MSKQSHVVQTCKEELVKTRNSQPCTREWYIVHLELRRISRGVYSPVGHLSIWSKYRSEEEALAAHKKLVPVAFYYFWYCHSSVFKTMKSFEKSIL